MRLRRAKDMEPVEQLDDRPRAMHGVRFDRADQGRRLSALRDRIREFPPIEGFSMWNGTYEAVDAEVLWAVLRELKPLRVLTLASSQWPSLIIAAALRANDRGEQARDIDPAKLGDRDVVFAMGVRTRVVLELLPTLEPGVIVHFHGVCLPWTSSPEQDLLQAFLAGNPDWEVLLGVHDLAKSEPDLVRRVVPSWRGDTRPSAFWLRRC